MPVDLTGSKMFFTAKSAITDGANDTGATITSNSSPTFVGNGNQPGNNVTFDGKMARIFVSSCPTVAEALSRVRNEYKRFIF